MSALIYTPFANEADARAVATKLLEERLVACVNLLPGVVSLFRWEDAVDEARECGVLLKTDASLLGKAVARLEVLHPYETPAIMGWPCDAVPDTTRSWLSATLIQ